LGKNNFPLEKQKITELEVGITNLKKKDFESQKTSSTRKFLRN
jgi:hypothetical protein